MSNYKRVEITWTREMASRLITLYEQHPSLYNTSSFNYFNKPIRHRALDTICDALNAEFATSLRPEDIQKKIHGLRTQYMSEISKIKKSIMANRGVASSSTDRIYTPRLWCFEAMSFINESNSKTSTNKLNLQNEFDERSGESGDLLYDDEDNDDDDDDGSKNVEIIDIVMNNNKNNHLKSDLKIESSINSNSMDPMVAFDDDHGSNQNKLPLQHLGASSSAKKRPHSSDDCGISRANISRSVRSIASNDVVLMDPLEGPAATADTASAAAYNSVFGNLVAVEMQTIEDQDILDGLKERILIEIYAAKRKYREKQQSI